MEDWWDDIFGKSLGFRRIAEADLALLSACVKRLKCFKEGIPENVSPHWSEHHNVRDEGVFRMIASEGLDFIEHAMDLAKELESNSEAEFLESCRFLLKEVDKIEELLVNNMEEMSIDGSEPGQRTEQTEPG